MENQNSWLIIFILLFGGLSCHRGIISKDSRGGKSTNVKELKFEPIKNIVIDQANYKIGPCEPTITINPKNKLQVAAGSVLDNVYISEDGGQSWENKKMTSTYGVFGDPVLVRTQNGDLLYAHLSNPTGYAYSSVEFLDRIVVQKSIDQGKSWSNGSFPPGDQLKDQDKHWLATDPITGNILLSWTEFDKYGSKFENHKSRILFSMSSDNGETWTPPVIVSEIEGDCVDEDQTTEGAYPAIDAQGNYYITWAFDEKIYVDVSKDQGKTWLEKDIFVADQPGGWAFEIQGIGRANGMPVMKCDNSLGKNHGSLYISWSDQRNGVADTDVWLSKSIDGGLTWSKSIRVNNDLPGKQQFFSSMDIDQSNGCLYWVFYDRRDYMDTKTDVYMAYTLNGGSKMYNLKISEEPFIPETAVFFGDYNDISVFDGHIRPIWTVQNNNKLSINTAIINVKL